MPTNLKRLLTGFLTTGLLAAASFADAAEVATGATPPPAPTSEAEAAGATELVPAGSVQPGFRPINGAAVTAEPFETDADSGSVIFRSPKRPSQVKTVPVDRAPPEHQAKPAEDQPAAELQPIVKQAEPQQLPVEEFAAEPAAEVTAEPTAEVTAEPAAEVTADAVTPPPAETVSQPPADTASEPTAPPRVGTMAFNGIEPGKATVAEAKKLWGEPAEESSADGISLFTFAMPPFKKVEALASDGQIMSVVVYLDPPMIAASVANELKLRDFVPVPIPDPTGQLLGQVYPERGVLFGFAVGQKLPHVSQIVVEPITGEPFVLRALYDFNHRYSANLEDLDFALSLDENDAQAHWVKSCVLLEVGRYEDALQQADTAARLDPDSMAYPLQKVRALGFLGRHDEAIELVRQIVAQDDLAQHLKAEAACRLGCLLATAAEPDHKGAIEQYQAAINLASPLVGTKQFEVRRSAKQVLVDANAGIGRSVAQGNYQRKSEVVAKWFNRASAYADQFAGGDNGPKDIVLKVLAQRLDAYTGMTGDADPTQAIDTAIQSARQLIAWSKDPLFKQQVEWLLGSTLMDAVRVEHARGQHLDALRYAEMAVGMLESAAPQRQLSPREQFAMGRFYFLAGAVHAVTKKDHDEASKWYAKALPLMTSPATEPTQDLALGRLGEWMVSMGVTFWEVGDKEKAVELTERGASLVKQAVAGGIMKESALSVPYANLASMHKALGNGEQAADFARMAKTLETAHSGTSLR